MALAIMIRLHPSSSVEYSRFIAALKAANIDLNRKMLSEIAIHDPAAFDKIVSLAMPGAKQAA